MTDVRVKNKPVHWIIVPNILDGNICGNCDGEGFGLRKVCPVGGFIMCGRFQQNCNKAIFNRICRMLI